MSSYAAVGRAFALLSAALFGGAVGMLTQRNSNINNSGSRGQLQQQQEENSVAVYHNESLNTSQLSPAAQKMMSKGLPSDERVRVFDGFIASLNYERRVPNWVLEYIPPIDPTNRDDKEKEKEEDPKAVRREGMKFFADPTVPEPFRVLPDDYSGGKQEQQQQYTRGLSRGHLAAAQFHKRTADEMAQTFNMNANIVPQDMTMNAVDWLRLENLTRKLRRHYEGGLWVVTGPLFHPRLVHGEPRSWGWDDSRPSSPITPIHTENNNSDNNASNTRKVVCYELVGKHDVAVPTHLFKVLLGERGDGSHEIAAFLMPNEPIVVERPLVSYQVPVREIEHKTGLQFFPNVISTDTVRSATSWRRKVNNNTHPQVLDPLPNICRRFQCEARTVALFQTYRNVARLRAAQSEPELQEVLLTIIEEQQRQQKNSNPQAQVQEAKEYWGKNKENLALDAAVVKEYDERRKELLGQSEL
ncbi:endonuclease G, mitochondrial [Trypanosoma theileri]|uniref:Endonuclease G, mitochondrial n=1 Tax=Trypanosoma theileri TaxID=67003 RepID=A0A1X0NQR8_9TRYP|nr:endonuclease G, mitochondrial [Trypanosoma theileri]ORC86878.1 endonuclease G, mitochondrial [Trypanosoma theileri]